MDESAPADESANEEEKRDTFAKVNPNTNPSVHSSTTLGSSTFLTGESIMYRYSDPKFVPHEDQMFVEPHFHGIQVDKHSKMEVPGVFQQLMMDACAGSLCHINVGGDNLIGNSQLQSPEILDGVNVVPNSFGDIVRPRDEGYYGGTESEYDTTTQMSDGTLESSEEGSDHEDEDIANTKNNCAVQEFISSFSDPISKEEFISGRDFDYDQFKCGVDDTDLNDLEVQATEIEDSGPDLDNNECRNEVNESNYAAHNVSQMNNVDTENLVEEESHEDLYQNQQQGHTTVAGSMDGNVNFAHDQDIPPCVLGDCGCAKQEIAQEISEQYLEGVRLGYKKRNRTGKDKVPDCRKPRDMGAIEIAMRTAEHRKTEHIFEPVLGMVFDSKEEGYEFYNMYSWEVGFGIIYNRCGPKTNKDYRSMQELCCQKAGSDRRVQNATKKVNCKARLKMLRTTDGGWYVADFVKEHNHPFAESCTEKREWGSHKRLDPYSLDVIRYLRENNVSPTRVRCIIGSMFGSLKGAPCTKRSIRTICSQIAREQMDNDVGKTVELFRQMKANDPDFQWSVDVGEGGRINTLMWCSGKSREQYACFGDVITFDTTYCTNFYKMPFGLFVGVNNHFQTIVFGGVLMRNETTESFKWVFTEFLNLMGGKPPQTVLTDQCKGMTIALGEVWPDTFHMWCKWHVLKKIIESLGPTYTKDATFRDEFYAIVNEMMTKAEFNKSWEDLCERYNLKDNPFMVRTFQCRSKWAKPWSKGNFCAGMTSTQRSESANWMLKRFVPRNSSMNHFVSQFNMLLEDRDMEEGREEDLTKQLVLKHNGIWPVERHAMKIYTRQSYFLFRKQVYQAADFRVTGKGADFYVVCRNRAEDLPIWRKKTYKVYVYAGGARYFCECGFFEHIGILCCHTIRLMIRLDVSQIPKAHIMTRWTRHAKDVLPEHMKSHSKDNNGVETLSIWKNRLNTKALEAVTKGNTDKQCRGILMKHLNAAIRELDEALLASSKLAETNSTDDGEQVIETDVESMHGNRYGASGSSAGMSDSDIKKLKAPLFERGHGHPICNRRRSGADIAIKKAAKRLGVRGKLSKKKKSITDFVEGTKSKPKSKSRRDNTKGMVEKPSSPKNLGLPFQSTFCTKCRKTGHNRNRCGVKGNQSDKLAVDSVAANRSKSIRCKKCDLKGHNESDCLVLDTDSNSYFK